MNTTCNLLRLNCRKTRMNPGLPNADIFMETYQLWVMDADAEGRRRAKVHRSCENEPQKAKRRTNYGLDGTIDRLPRAGVLRAGSAALANGPARKSVRATSWLSKC